MLSGNQLPEDADPIAMAYAGHQFGVFVPRLGDGRAILLGELRGRDGVLRDLQLKGAGRTPFSRNGDGRAVVGPMLREYLVSEAMHALGVPTTRSLAVVTTGEQVFRDVALPGAVLTRVAASHVRVGTFQYFAARGDQDAVRELLEYVIARHYPAAREADVPALAVLKEVAQRQAALVTDWMLLGFIHGVMNTDNMAISGETIDYGPCAFMDDYDPKRVFSSIDHAGRYAYANQPVIAQWNLARFAETLLFLIDPEAEKAVALATEALEPFVAEFDAHFLAGMRRKLGLSSAADGDAVLIKRLLSARCSVPRRTSPSRSALSLWRPRAPEADAPAGAVRRKRGTRGLAAGLAGAPGGRSAIREPSGSRACVRRKPCLHSAQSPRASGARCRRGRRLQPLPQAPRNPATALRRPARSRRYALAAAALRTCAADLLRYLTRRLRACHSPAIHGRYCIVGNGRAQLQAAEVWLATR